jgi:hypothetical protein
VSDDQAAVLSADQREVVGQTITDALRYRTPDAGCTGCDEHPAWLCKDHAADLDMEASPMSSAKCLATLYLFTTRPARSPILSAITPSAGESRSSPSGTWPK